MTKIISALVHKRTSVKFLLDLAIWTAATPLAFLIRLDTEVGEYAAAVVALSLVALSVKAGIIYFFRFHRQSWQKVSFADPYVLLKGVGFGSLILLATAFLLNPYLIQSIPRSIPLIDGMLGLLFLAGTRCLSRFVYDWRSRRATDGVARRVIIVGAGESGAMMARELLRHPDGRVAPVGFLDDDSQKQRQSLMGLKVLGRIKELTKVVDQTAAVEVIIAVPSAAGPLVRRVVSLAREAQVSYRIMPSIYDILSGKVPITKVRDVDVADLLGRDAVHLDLEKASAYVKDRVVLVTGAGGSIGGEIVRQLAHFEPRQVILLGRGENSLFELERDLQRSAPELCTCTIVGNVRDERKLDHVFDRFAPQVVFHAAAHKHVPLMELNPDEAVFNNIAGTKNLVELALKHQVQRFVNISTDKAVNPTSVMGASKRVAEYVVEGASRKAGSGQCFVSVRFGNVLGSRGSVVPLFQEQIRNGGPVTITHPDMTRYFKTIPEAAGLVLHAAGIGENGRIYVLDMGKPVKIVDLARHLIHLSGLEPDVEIEIQCTGVRPGEKLYEELLTAEEGTVASNHEGIFIANNAALPLDGQLEALLQDLFDAGARRDAGAVRRILKRLIPSYKPNGPVEQQKPPARSVKARRKIAVS